MSVKTTERLFMMVRCETCDQETLKPLSRLVMQHNLACPACGNAMDLDDGDNAKLMRELAGLCERYDGKSGRGSRGERRAT
jgi:ribosomal protein S27E